MPRASHVRTIVALAVSSALLAACGGSDEPSTKRKTGRDAARAGYFTSTESQALSPPLDAYSAALEAFTAGNELCNDEADRLFEAGKPPAAQAKCHIEEFASMVDATAAVSTALASLEGDYRVECDDARTRLAAFLTKLEAAWAKPRANWQGFARTGKLSASVATNDATVAYEMSDAFLEAEVPALVEACFTEADRAAEAE